MKVHPFERAKLGKAPFHCTGVTVNWYVTAGGAHRQPGGSCDYCGTGILYEYHIKSSDGREFVVGSDCVAKTGGHEHVEGFKRAKSDLLAKQRSAKRKALWEERQAKWAAEAAAKRVEFVKANPGLVERLKAKADTGSYFFQSLLGNVERYGSLTERQLAAALKSLAEDDKRAALETGSSYVGTVGKPITGDWEVLRVASWQGQYYPFPVTYLNVMTDGANLFVYKGSYNCGPKGSKVHGTFTVKEHSEYNGAKQTVLARPRKDFAVDRAEQAEAA